MKRNRSVLEKVIIEIVFVFLFIATIIICVSNESLTTPTIDVLFYIFAFALTFFGIIANFTPIGWVATPLCLVYLTAHVAILETNNTTSLTASMITFYLFFFLLMITAVVLSFFYEPKVRIAKVVITLVTLCFISFIFILTFSEAADALSNASSIYGSSTAKEFYLKVALYSFIEFIAAVGTGVGFISNYLTNKESKQEN